MSRRDKAAIWMPLYVRDWEDKTAYLDCEQDGAYGRLIRHYWRDGATPADDDSELAVIVRMPKPKWLKIRSKIAPYFTIRDGKWFHERVEEELARAAELIKR